nr:endo alpha-1,4 polygalactosaminidase [Lachnospiraceae bacterium]
MSNLKHENKGLVKLLAVAIIAGLFMGCFFVPKTYAKYIPKDYGVFIGVDMTTASIKEKTSYIKKIGKYKEVVIDASYWSNSDIKKLKKYSTKKVYSYINIGAIENFRSYYNQFKGHTLGEYENWPEERWMDVSYKNWQTYVTKTMGPKLSKKGIDGFFVDNCDVYYHYHKTKIYKGLS